MTAHRNPSQGDGPPTVPPDRRPVADATAKYVGRYEIVRTLGAGGMGTVYLAKDAQLNRQVALKVPRLTGGDTAQIRARFLREARAAATIQHPNVCPVFDVGEHDGVPFVAMAFIKGKPLSEVIRGKPLPLAGVAALVRRIAQAMAAAHEAGIVHRDLKLANVMLDPKNQPVVMDFGLATCPEQDGERLTQEGAILGTPAYMSPEQVNGDLKAIGPATDVYSLGVILYQLITGRLPFQGTVGQILAAIVTRDPEPPSKLRPDLDTALEQICLVAMRREIADRYATMDALAKALGEYLQTKTPQPAGSAPQALPTTTPVGPSAATAPTEATSTTRILAGLLERTHGRPRVGFWSVIAATVLLLAAVVVAVLLLRGGGDPKRGGDVTVSVQVPGVTNVTNVTVTFILDGRQISLEELNGPMRLKAGEHELRMRDRDGKEEVRRFEVRDGDEGRQVFVLPDEPKGPPGELRVFRKHQQVVSSVAFSPDGRRAVSAGHPGSFDPGELILWDVEVEGKPLTTKSLPGAWQVASLPDGRFVVSQGTPNTCRAVLWDRDLKADLRTYEVPGGKSASPAGAMSVSTDGRRLFYCPASDPMSPYVGYLWDVETGDTRPSLPTGHAHFSCFVGRDRLLTAGVSGHASPRPISAEEVVLWDVDAGKEVRNFRGHSEAVFAVAASPNGRTAASGSGDVANSIRLWDVDGGGEKGVLGGHKGRVTSLAFSPDGSRLLSGSSDRTVRLWDVASGKELHCFRGHEAGVTSVACSPGGRRALSGSGDKTVRLWQLPE